MEKLLIWWCSFSPASTCCGPVCRQVISKLSCKTQTTIELQMKLCIALPTCSNRKTIHSDLPRRIMRRIFLCTEPTQAGKNQLHSEYQNEQQRSKLKVYTHQSAKFFLPDAPTLIIRANKRGGSLYYFVSIRVAESALLATFWLHNFW